MRERERGGKREGAKEREREIWHTTLYIRTCLIELNYIDLKRLEIIKEDNYRY